MEDYERENDIGLSLAIRSYVYSLFHIVFGSEPTAERTELILSEETRKAFEDVQENLVKSSSKELRAVANETFGTAEKTTSQYLYDLIDYLKGYAHHMGDEKFVDRLKTDYTKLFLVPGDTYVKPWESAYVSTDALLFQESTLDVRNYYHDAGYKLKAEKQFPDDHIAAMMDYMTHMSHSAYEAFADGEDEDACELITTQHRFLDDHVLNWIDGFADAVAKKDDWGPYRIFAYAMAAIVRVDRAETELLKNELYELRVDEEEEADEGLDDADQF